MHPILAARTNFSIGESILTTEALIAGAKEVGAKAIAITDTMSVTAMIDFTNKAKKADLKPVIGCRLRLVDDPAWRKVKGEKSKTPPEYYMTWYVLSEKGMLALFRLLSLANTEERFYHVPKLSFTDLFNELDHVGPDDVAIATGDVLSIVHHKECENILFAICDRISKNRVFAQLTPINTPYWDTVNKKVIALGEKLALPFLVTRPVCYAKDGADSAEIMGAIAKNRKVTDFFHSSPYERDLHPLTLKELGEQCKQTIKRLKDRGASDPAKAFYNGLTNLSRLVDMVDYEWKKAPVSLPKMAADEFAEVRKECLKGFRERFSDSVFGHKPSAEELRSVYMPRLAYELGVLRSLGFSGYFLLVQDVVRFAKTNGILVGPGRGSVGGSLVAYLMGITDCDPLRFGLLFERFINPDRIDLPDADLDFMSERRHEVVDYLVTKYGRNRVSGISNYGTLGPASAIRDVARVFGLPENEYRCSKLMPKKHGAHVPLKEAVEQVSEIKAYSEKHSAIWEQSLKLEGVLRNLAQHAAGVVVGGCDLVERGVIERRKGEPVVCWDKRIVEDQGLVKMDILGLSTLDLIALTQNYITKRHSKRVNLMKIPLDDEKVLANFAAALTTGVFQFESGGMRRLLKELGKDGTITFDDITAATALYRPGPMESGMMDSYWRRKQGIETVEYDHELMEPILKPTFGVMVYQEQVMQVARTIAGYSAPDADKLRKIMGKKLPEEMKKERGKFVDGCVATIGCDAEWAGLLFDKIEGFAGYGFNKSHSVEYTLISYQCMWLKTNYPVEFFAAALTLMDQDRLPALLKDADKLGIEVDFPDINLSTGQFEILTDTRLSVPFNRVKGLSETATKAILAARAAGPFSSRADLEKRVERRKCNIRVINALDAVGAFARIESGQPPAKHPSRIKDQRDLLPGLVTATVPVHRDLATDKMTKLEIVALQREWYELGDGYAVKIGFGKTARFMVITDAPTSEQENVGLGWGKSFETIGEALSECGLTRNDGYWTALIKRTKKEKQVTPEEIGKYAPFLKREIELLKPPVIVLLGSQTVRHFLPDFKGKASEAAGTVVYSAELDANLVVGFNPGEIHFNPEKQADLNAVFAAVAQIVD